MTKEIFENLYLQFIYLIEKELYKLMVKGINLNRSTKCYFPT